MCYIPSARNTDSRNTAYNHSLLSVIIIKNLEEDHSQVIQFFEIILFYKTMSNFLWLPLLQQTRSRADPLQKVGNLDILMRLIISNGKPIFVSSFRIRIVI